MYRIRYFTQQIHPDILDKSILGRSIYFLNWCRWKLETAVQRLMLKYLAREEALPSHSLVGLLKGFDRDVQGEILEKELTSPKYTHGIDAEAVMRRADRYMVAKQGSVLADAVPNARPDRPKSLSNLAGMYGVGGRSRRYALGPRSHLVNPEGDVESLDEEK